MEYDVLMGSGAMMYVPHFIKIDSDNQKLIGGIHKHTGIRTISRSHKPTFFSE
jgi:hypothetical protein